MSLLSFCISQLSYEEARIVLNGVPLDMTSSFRPGSRFAPGAIREASFEFEDYDYLSGNNMLDVPFFDVGDMELSGPIDVIMEEIFEETKNHVYNNKIPVSLGGEHLVTFPIIKALSTKYPTLDIVVFDAHLDLKESYLKAKLSHAAVMRRIIEYNQDCQIVHFGARSATKEEKELADTHPQVHIKNGLSALRQNAPLYISIDMDVLDPSAAPGVGNPEPGGWSYKALARMLQKFKGRQIVGADVVEISPPYDPSKITAITGAKLVRDLFFLIRHSL
jgi:agmatinase